MLLLAVESSCDDSAVAVLDGCRPLSSVVAGQAGHEGYGGVVPEIASRMHLRTLPDLVERALEEAGAGLDDIEAMAATAGPGLVGSLLVGLSWTKAAAWARGVPFLAINHLAAHLYVHYSGREVDFPAVALIASGGHTSLMRMEGWWRMELLGSTRDDAAGEAFDKAAKLLGLSFPGGAELEALAREGDPHAVDLPRPLSDPDLPEFSFSGLKTAFRLSLEAGADPADLAASFQRAVCEILASKTLRQAELSKASTVMAGGGVTANGPLREMLSRGAAGRGLELLLPGPGLSTDNAVMVGRAAAAVLDRDPAARSPLSANAFARWPGGELAALVEGEAG